MPQVTINIKTIVPAIIESRREKLQILADKLDDNSLRVLAEIVNDTPNINNTLAAHEHTLKQAIKSI
jgi:hypothetical protein